MKKLSNLWLPLLCVLVLCNIVAVVYFHKKQAQHDRLARANQVVATAVKGDSMPSDEMQRLRQVSNAVDAKQPLTNEQLLFLLSLPDKKYNGRLSQIGRFTSVVTLMMVKTLTPSQKQIVKQTLVPRLSVQDTPHASGLSDVQYNKLTACDILAHQDIRDAVPAMLPLLDDPNRQTRNVVKRDLRQLGYSVQ